jgi:HPt (histidine-containing phosphotransfer) domain-containing protein
MMCTYNLDYLKKISNDDQAFIREILNTFVESASEVVNAMTLLYKQEEFLQLSKVIHKFIPSLNFIGAKDDLEEDLNKLEIYLAKDQHPELVPDLLEKSKVTLNKLIDRISNEQLN